MQYHNNGDQQTTWTGPAGSASGKVRSGLIGSSSREIPPANAQFQLVDWTSEAQWEWELECLHVECSRSCALAMPRTGVSLLSYYLHHGSAESPLVRSKWDADRQASFDVVRGSSGGEHRLVGLKPGVQTPFRSGTLYPIQLTIAYRRSHKWSTGLCVKDEFYQNNY